MPDASTATRRFQTGLVAGIVLLAALLRFWTIGRGLPYSVGADEPDIMIRVLHMLRTGDFNPHGFFDYPTLTFYLQVVVAAARFLAGAARAQWVSLDGIWPGDFYLWARAFTALLGVITVYVVYRAGTRWGAMTAVIAGLAMAVQPQLVREAHYALTDTPLTLFVALTMLTSLVANETGRLRWFILAGAMAGLSAATKYNGGTALLMALAATVSVGALGMRTLAILGVVIGAASAFLLAAPYSLLDLPGFLNGFASLMQHYNQERPGVDAAAVVYLKHIADWFSVILPGGRLYRSTSALAMAIGGLGALRIAAGILSPAQRVRSLILIVFPLAYFWFISSHSLVYARYAMPLVPAMCIAFGHGVTMVWTALPAWLPNAAHRRLALAGLLLTLLPSALQAFGFDASRRQVSTTELTAQWLVDHVAPGELVVLESNAILLPPAIKSENTLRLISEPIEAYREKGAVYLVSTSTETDKYFSDPVRFARQVSEYKALLQATHIVMIVPEVKGQRPGPTWQILKVNP